ncbi:ArsR/SmtB family transcription factor [[Clostridium] polysaccharolyticum]|uniref:DNA-binding transcriptional regulator, ArsR family n=1 Tax=[Clostridium] polysaccharolyticum TaxID=29364 RepID=A0A1I0DW94_9FIRM|nr:metalloregulator ArsR/SmtB family transcription factor [[Clostridium] polysaccharolyticum]SET36787.1 DNA-binding transcriptional regulator, ArsR family [[Clostridium] polysaccharolyticum]
MSKNDTEHAHNFHVETCDIQCVHPEVVQQAFNNMPAEEYLYDLAELFKVFGDTTRIKILYVLFESEMCVCDIAEILNMTQSAISHQLRVLKQNRLVRFRREGKNIIYSLADEHVRSIINQGMEHINE